MKKAVITGGAGFIGSNLAHELVKRGWGVTIIDIDPAFRKKTLPKKAKLLVFDIRDVKKTEKAFRGADVVFHTAALPRVQFSIDYPLESSDNNINGTVAVLSAAAKAKVRRVVYSASGSAYGNQKVLPLVETMPIAPVNPYGLQKYVGELFMKMWPGIYGVETVSLRYFNVYGPGMDPNGAYALAMGAFMKARQTGKPITIFGDGTVTRDFTHVYDVVEANILAAESKKVGKGEEINIGAGRNVTIQYVASLFGGPIVYAPPRIEAHDSKADNRKAKKLLGWKPRVKLEAGVAELKKLAGL